MDIVEIRRTNLRALMQKETATAISKRLGYKFPSYLSQIAGPNPTREITEKTAREFEKKLALKPGALDVPPGGPATAVSGDVTTLVADVIRVVGSVCAGEKVTLPMDKLADVIALAFQDAADHGGQPREQHVKALVKLVR